MDLIVLAAGQGKRFKSSQISNKCLVKIKKLTLIEKIISEANQTLDIKNNYVVVGHKQRNIKSHLKKYKINYINNNFYKTKEMLYSFKLGLEQSTNDILICYSDIYFSKSLFKLIKQQNKKEIVLPVKADWQSVWKKRKKDIVKDCESLIFNKKFYLTNIGYKILNRHDAMAQYMGIIYIPRSKVKNILKKIKAYKGQQHITNFLNHLVQHSIKIKCVTNKIPWYEFDDVQDLYNFNS